MLYINSTQVDNHCWKFAITDGYQTMWNASYNRGLLVIRIDDKDFGKIFGEAKISEKEESATLGKCMSLLYNWMQLNPFSCNEKIDPLWKVNDELNFRYELQQSQREKNTLPLSGDTVFDIRDYKEGSHRVPIDKYPVGSTFTLTGTLLDLGLTTLEYGYFIFEVVTDDHPAGTVIIANINNDPDSFSDDFFKNIDKEVTFEIVVTDDGHLAVNKATLKN